MHVRCNNTSMLYVFIYIQQYTRIIRITLEFSNNINIYTCVMLLSGNVYGSIFRGNSGTNLNRKLWT